MSYVKVQEKKKTGPKPKNPKPELSEIQKQELLHKYVDELISIFKDNDSSASERKRNNAKIREYYKQKIIELGMNIDYFRLVTYKNNYITFEEFLQKIPKDEQQLYIENEQLCFQYINTIKCNAEDMVDRTDISRDCAKKLRSIDKNAKHIIDYYRVLYNAQKTLKEKLGNTGNTDINEMLYKYNFIKDLYFEN